MKVRNSLSRDLAKENPLLEMGEVVFDRGVGRSKVGDGKTRWNDLPFTPPAPPKSAAIAAPIAPGATYDGAVAGSSVAAINAIRTTLRNAGLTD